MLLKLRTYFFKMVNIYSKCIFQGLSNKIIDNAWKWVFPKIVMKYCLYYVIIYIYFHGLTFAIATTLKLRVINYLYFSGFRRTGNLRLLHSPYTAEARARNGLEHRLQKSLPWAWVRVLYICIQVVMPMKYWVNNIWHLHSLSTDRFFKVREIRVQERYRWGARVADAISALPLTTEFQAVSPIGRGYSCMGDSKIELDWASIYGKLKPTAAILKASPEKYSGVTETKIKTLTFSTEIWRTIYVDWILIEWRSFPILCSDATEISNMAAGCPFNMAAVGHNKSILCSSQNNLVIFMFGVVERNILAAF